MPVVGVSDLLRPKLLTFVGRKLLGRQLRRIGAPGLVDTLSIPIASSRNFQDFVHSVCPCPETQPVLVPGMESQPVLVWRMKATNAVLSPFEDEFD